jgi:hypothetical protein
MMKTLVRDNNWTPQTLDELFLDDLDHHGLVFWYDDSVHVAKEIKKQSDTT